MIFHPKAPKNSLDGKVSEVGESDNGQIGALICQEQ